MVQSRRTEILQPCDDTVATTRKEKFLERRTHNRRTKTRQRNQKSTKRKQFIQSNNSKRVININFKFFCLQPIEREEKPFKPLIVPRKLQAALPYRDKPKYGVKASEKKKTIDRVAVIREPHEQKVSSMIKKIKATYEHKQNQLKMATKERMEKHKQMVEAFENKRMKKLQAKKKEVFRAKSKAAKKQETKGFKN